VIDANNNASPLVRLPDGNVSANITNAPVGGIYTLVLQATSGSGQMLVQVNSAAPVPLALGTTVVDVTSESQRFTLENDTPAVISLVAPDTPDEPGMLPGLVLAHAEIGEEIIRIQPGMLPGISINLPADTAFILTVQGSETPGQLTIDWQQEPQDSSSTPESSDSSDASSSESSSDTANESSSHVEPCVVYFSSPVNVRPGPGTQYAPPLGTAQTGTTLTATGHNGDYSWYQVEYAGQYGWVALFVNGTEAQGDCTGLQIASDPGSPPPTDSTPYTATPSPTYTYTPGGPTVTPVPPTATYTPSYTPTATYTPGGPTPTNVPPTATYTYTFTPTQTTAAPVQPTATYTPSYTPTTPPAAQQAPPDANFNSPLNIPLDNTASVLDFVSYPDGDTIDRVRFDITGMNQNASLSGGRARLVIAASCFGQGTGNITFFTNGQTFSCGQTLVDREVTYNSRTGTITIEAIGGTSTYVQWVLTGTATRVN